MTQTTMTKITTLTDEQRLAAAELVAQTLRDHLTYNLGDMLTIWTLDALENLGIAEEDFEECEDAIDAVTDVITSVVVTTN